MSDSHIDVNDGGSHCQVLVFLRMREILKRVFRVSLLDLLRKEPPKLRLLICSLRKFFLKLGKFLFLLYSPKRGCSIVFAFLDWIDYCCFVRNCEIQVDMSICDELRNLRRDVEFCRIA